MSWVTKCTLTLASKVLTDLDLDVICTWPQSVRNLLLIQEIWKLQNPLHIFTNAVVHIIYRNQIVSFSGYPRCTVIDMTTEWSCKKRSCKLFSSKWQLAIRLCLMLSQSKIVCLFAELVLGFFRELQWDGAVSKAMLNDFGFVLDHCTDEFALEFLTDLLKPPALICILQVDGRT